NYFEQMKGRGVRIANQDQMANVTPPQDGPDGTSLPVPAKTRFVVVDAVGVCCANKNERGSLDRKPGQSLKQVFDYIKAGGKEADAVSALAAKLNRLATEMSPKQHDEVRKHAAGQGIDELVHGLVSAIDDNNVEAKAREMNPGVAELTEKQL